MLLENKTILVAGAAGLLGSHVVEELLKHGAKVIATDVSQELVAQRLSALGLNIDTDTDTNTDSADVKCQALNLLDEKGVRYFFQSINTLDGAVNCSYPRNKAYGKHFYDVDLANFNENVSLHLGSAFLFTQQCAAYFEKNQAPLSVVNMSSIYGVVAPKFDVYDNTQMTTPVEYAAIKSAIQHISRYTTAYVNNSDFRVNCVSPGGILDQQPQSFLEKYRDSCTSKGMLDPTDVAGTFLFLLSDQSKYINGQNIVIDDGWTL